MKLLRKLLADVDAVTDEMIKSQEPEEEIQDGAKIIGPLSLDLQKLFTLRGLLADKLTETVGVHLREHLDPKHTSEMCKDFAASVALLEEEIDFAGKVLLRELYGEFKTSTGVEITKGWNVVAPPEKKKFGIEVIGIEIGGPYSFSEFLRGIRA
ncbi:MAG: hypothetical protein Q7R98_02270 [Candidatus Jorgensenbacteria bacterium]|nr:hypothetical protein [Candidatus Jorgensenbacteria bacterium]